MIQFLTLAEPTKYKTVVIPRHEVDKMLINQIGISPLYPGKCYVFQSLENNLFTVKLTEEPGFVNLSSTPVRCNRNPFAGMKIISNSLDETMMSRTRKFEFEGFEGKEFCFRETIIEKNIIRRTAWVEPSYVVVDMDGCPPEEPVHPQDEHVCLQDKLCETDSLSSSP
jgi:hypothetical protein